MKKTPPNYKYLSEKLQYLTYQAGIYTALSLIKKIKIPQETGKFLFSLDNLDKEEKKILYEMIKMQITSDHKLEAIFIQSLKRDPTSL